jgi:hypothetical protein
MNPWQCCFVIQSAHVPQSDWMRLGLQRAMPKYADGVYYSANCEPSSGERLLFRSLATRTRRTVREVALAMGRERGDMIGGSIEDYIRVSEGCAIET